MELSRGAVADLVAGVTGNTVTLQVLGIKRLGNGQAQQDRFRLLLSDGEYSHSCMLATQLADMVNGDQVREGSIITLVDYICNQVQNKKVVIVLNLRVEQLEAPRIGNPQQYDKVHGAAGGAPPPQLPGGAPQEQQQIGGGYGAPPQGAAPYGAPPPNQGRNQYGAAAGGYGAPAPSGPYGAPAPSAPQVQQAPPSNPYGQPGPQYRGNGPVARNEAPSNIMPINALNSYQNRWTIKARVTTKSDIRRYSNARGDGKFFSFDLLDAQGGEIRVVCWNDQCDRWEPIIEQGKVYVISKASLRNKRGNFNQTRHQYEIHLENSSVVELCSEEDDIPHIHFNFSKIATVQDTPPGNVVDIIGVVESVMDWTTITKRDGTDTQKRSVIIRDDSNTSIELTLWGKYANEPGDQLQQAIQNGVHPILAVKSARVGDYNGRTLSTVASSTLSVDPLEEPAAVQLRQWYDAGGAALAAESLSRQGGGGGRTDRRITIAQIKEEGLGMGEKPDWVLLSGAVTYLRTENMSYPACTNKVAEGRQCNKKLQDSGDGTWHCERCQGNFEPEFRYMLSLTLSDHTGETWATAFQEQGVEIMGGRSAAEVKDMRDNLGDAEFSSYIQDLTFRHYLVKLKVTNETYQDEQKLRTSVVSVTPPNYAQEGKVLLDLIGKMERGEPVFAPAGAQQQQPQYGGAPPQYGGGGGGAGYGGAPQQQYGGYNKQTPPRQGGAPQGNYGGYGGGYQNQNTMQNAYQQPGGQAGYGGAGAPQGGGYGGGY